MRNLALLISAYLAFAANKFEPYELDANTWASFKQEHNKQYDDAQVEELRRSIFAKNLQAIQQFNANADEREYFSLGANELADLSELEMKQINGFRLPRDGNGLIQRHSLRNSAEAAEFIRSILEDNSTAVPAELDWRKVPGRVSAVKNQGMCGSCWAFASTGALEGQEKVRLGGAASLVELSEQNLVDCVKKDFGCNGGQMADAFDFVKTEGGIDDEHSYPYEARTRKCRFNKAKSVMSDAGHATLKAGDEEQLKQMVAKFGPVAVGIDASSIWFQLYRHGVYVNKHCHSKDDELDHGVLVVGYGTDPKKGDYWLVKNSWGPKWGENGYIRMARNKKNMCGIATVATVPTF